MLGGVGGAVRNGRAYPIWPNRWGVYNTTIIDSFCLTDQAIEISEQDEIKGMHDCGVNVFRSEMLANPSAIVAHGFQKRGVIIAPRRNVARRQRDADFVTRCFAEQLR